MEEQEEVRESEQASDLIQEADAVGARIGGMARSLNEKFGDRADSMLSQINNQLNELIADALEVEEPEQWQVEIEVEEEKPEATETTSEPEDSSPSPATLKTETPEAPTEAPPSTAVYLPPAAPMVPAKRERSAKRGLGVGVRR